MRWKRTMKWTSVSGEEEWVGASLFLVGTPVSVWYATIQHIRQQCNFLCNVFVRMRPSQRAQRLVQRVTTSRARRRYTYHRTNVVSYQPASPSPFHMGMSGF